MFLTVPQLFYPYDFIRYFNNPAETILPFLWGIFEKSQILARYIFDTSQRRQGIDTFFEICSRRLKDVTKTIFLRFI